MGFESYQKRSKLESVLKFANYMRSVLEEMKFVILSLKKT